MNQIHSRKILVLVFAAILIAAGLWVAFAHSNTYNPQATREAENGGPQIIDLNNSEDLAKILLPKQYDIAKSAINDYIKQRVDPSAKTAAIVGQPQQDSKGIISLMVQVGANPNSTFTATIDRLSDYRAMTFAVPQSNYSVRIQVYAN
jgi:hypothetical protein